ncbi:hypothetical protein CASFOL_021082 [Castilleja foliolosa]|uniref:ATP-dependent DNA helicase n=1 Tax=Castilleja foliolosa TaxID=1961234 RepID=A0ABD3CVI6_9LAMI
MHARQQLRSKSFPKKFECSSRFDKDGYVHYKRRDTPQRATKNGVAFDNRYVVPYNEHLCRHFNAHINVEHCGWSMMIKYLFKYISKGADRVRFCIIRSDEASSVDPQNANPVVNEIKNFLDGRYICPHEASWRILNFPIHECTPVVEVLAVHLKDMQNVTFKENLKLQAIVRNPSFGKTTLTEWMERNKLDPDGLDLTYVNYSSRYRWYRTGMCWIPRMRLRNPAIGLLAYVHPTSGELFYLRMLLCHQRGCKSFADIRTVSNVIHNTYRSACDALGLLGDDREWLTAFIESSSWATSSELRVLFVHMLLFCEVTQPLYFWENQWRCMGDDIRLRFATKISTPDFFVNDSEIQQSILFELEKMLNSGTPSKSQSDFGLPMPSTSFFASVGNRLLMEETCYDRNSLAADHSRSHLLLNSDQKQVYNCILSAYHTNSQILLFVYGHGGTGKTFLWRTIISFFRSVGKIVLAVAASGIASLLLPSGRTAHSRFKIPIDLTDQSTCHVKKGTHLAQLLRETLLIIWDEAPMSDRRCFECLDKTLRDINDDANHPFGGKTVLLGGDFRQTLPVKVKCTRSEIIDSTLPKSNLWQHFRIFKLRENMRLRSHSNSSESTDDASEFAAWLLSIGDGLVGEPDMNDPQNTCRIQIPPQYLIRATEKRLHALISFIYDDFILNNPSADNLSTRAIVCPTNDTSDDINKAVLGLTPGDCKVYTSYDVMVTHGGSHADTEALYPQEYLNQLTFPGIPPHELTLKINAPIILIRNINQTLGLCNGTRLIVSQLLPRIIEAQIITGTAIGTRVYIPRIKHTTTTQMACQRIRDITEQQMPLTIEIRVLRKWISKGKKEELCYQFVDIHGDGIEATAEVKHIDRRTYMATVDHRASLVIGQKAKFHPVTNPNIPTVYFNFATYETIKTRIKDAKLLTVGREVEITLWQEMRHLIADNVIPGHIVAITSTMVTEHNGLLQLESTYLTTTVINPDLPQTMDHVGRLRALPPMQVTETHDRKVTLLDLKLGKQQDIQGSKNFTCEAIIKEIHGERGWYYVLCSKCNSKLYPQRESGRLNFVCKDDDNITPNFRYSVNATIMDASGSADAIFFNDSMQAITNISCEDIVRKYADTTNPKAVPQLLRSAIGTPKLLHLSLKNDGKIVVSNVSEVASATSTQSIGKVAGTSTFTPTTPLPKSATSKRQLEDSPGP